MTISRAEKDRLRKSKTAEIEKLKYDKGLLIDQREPKQRIDDINAKIEDAKKQLRDIESLPVYDQVTGTQIVVNDSYVGQISTGIHIGDVVQNNIKEEAFWQSLDFELLENEFSRLYLEMKKLSKTDEQDIAVGEIAKAKKAITEKNYKKIIEYLRSAGKWAFDIASKIGTTLAAEALKIALGLR